MTTESMIRNMTDRELIDEATNRRDDPLIDELARRLDEANETGPLLQACRGYDIDTPDDLDRAIKGDDNDQ